MTLMQAQVDTACWVSLSTTPGTVVIAATANGDGPFTYSWSDGSTGSVLTYSPNMLNTYCVTVTSSSGCTADACITITSGGGGCYGGIQSNGDTLLSAFSQGVAPFTYQWNNGQTDAGVWVTVDGYYCVTITDANGCVAEDCYLVESPTTDCSVVISPNPDGTVTAEAVGVAPFEYFWDNNMTGSTITPPASGGYCVSVLDASGCVAGDCAGDSTVGGVAVYISAQNNVLFAVPNINTPVTYLWSTGETTSSITVNAPGTYCVTIMGGGAVATACYEYGANTGFFALYGAIFTGATGNPASVNSGIVYLIKYDEAAGTLTAVDSTQFTAYDSMGVTAGYYNFTTNDVGPYLIKAALWSSSPGYDFHLPTYYGNVLFWDDATEITLGDFAPNIANITMIVGENTGGPGFVGGLVSEGANIVGHNGNEPEFGPGDPVAGATVILMNVSGAAVAYAKTDATGHYSITNIPYGDYTICVDMAAKVHGCTDVNISANGSNVVNFTTQDGSVIAGVEASPVFGNAGIAPNPATEVTTLTFTAKTSATVLLQLIDNQGRKVWSNQTSAVVGVNSVAIPMFGLPNGLYMVSATDGNGLVTFRMVKN